MKTNINGSVLRCVKGERLKNQVCEGRETDQYKWKCAQVCEGRETEE